MRIKVHQVLLFTVAFFAVLIILNLVKNKIIKKTNDVQSSYSQEDILQKIQPNINAFFQNKNINLNNENVTKLDVYIFKNKREFILLVESKQEDPKLFKFVFESFSPGFGLRNKLKELTFPEGSYNFSSAGMNNSGLFFVLKYPPQFYSEYQRIDFEAVSKKQILVSESILTNSFLQADRNSLALLYYLGQKLGFDKVNIYVYPDRPPLTMEIGGTEFESKIYKKLESQYNKFLEVEAKEK